MFELFDHTADLGLRVQAASLAELLMEAGRGILAMHVANPEAVRPVETRVIELSADDAAYLVFDWLSELLFAFESDKLLLSEYEVALQRSPDRKLELRAVCRGEPMDQNRHVMDHEVKAITYHDLRVEEQPGGTWFAEVIVDI